MAPAVAEECLMELKMAAMATATSVEGASHMTTESRSERITSEVIVM
jgi:hypothetical protein